MPSNSLAAADYVNQKANDARKENKSMKKEIDCLNERCEYLAKRLIEVERQIETLTREQ